MFPTELKTQVVLVPDPDRGVKEEASKAFNLSRQNQTLNAFLYSLLMHTWYDVLVMYSMSLVGNRKSFWKGA